MDGHQLKRSAKEPEAKRAPDGDGDPGFALGLQNHRPPHDGDDGFHDDDEAPTTIDLHDSLMAVMVSMMAMMMMYIHDSTLTPL